MADKSVLRAGIDAFKNGDFNAAFIHLTHIYSQLSQLDTKDRLILHEYMAATLERLGRLEDGLVHAREMIRVSDSSHKGYLRLGKLLRLLGDEKGAVATYKIGLKRAKSGANEIKSLLEKLEGSLLSKRGPTLDPFERLSPDVISRIQRYLKIKGSKDVLSIYRMSRASLKYVPLFYPFKVTKSMTITSIRSCLRAFGGHLVCTSDGLNQLLKALSKPLGHKLDIRLLELHRVESEAIHREAFERALQANPLTNLARLEIYSSRIKSEHLGLLLGKAGNFCDLVIKESEIWPDVDFLHLENLCGLRTFIFDGTGCNSQSIADALRNCKSLCHLGWNSPDSFHFIADGKLASLSGLRRLEIPGDLVMGIQKHIYSFALVTHLSLGMSHLRGSSWNVFEVQPDLFVNLRRLEIRGGQEIQLYSSSTACHFPRLEHLLFQSSLGLPELCKWEMPRLKTFCLVGCEVMSLSQIPLFESFVDQVLIARFSSYLRPTCFKRLADDFSAGKIRVLGIGEAYKFYQTDGFGKITKLSESRPFQSLLQSETEINDRIGRIWNGQRGV